MYHKTSQSGLVVQYNVGRAQGPLIGILNM